MILSSVCLSVRLSVFDELYFVAQSRCTRDYGSKVILSCFWDWTSYSLLQMLMMYRLATSGEEADGHHKQTSVSKM